MTIQVYLDQGGAWRWRLVSVNGKTSATSNESFYSKSNAKRAARRLAQTIRQATAVEVTEEAS